MTKAMRKTNLQSVAGDVARQVTAEQDYLQYLRGLRFRVVQSGRAADYFEPITDMIHTSKARIHYLHLEVRRLNLGWGR